MFRTDHVASGVCRTTGQVGRGIRARSSELAAPVGVQQRSVVTYFITKVGVTNLYHFV